MKNLQLIMVLACLFLAAAPSLFARQAGVKAGLKIGYSIAGMSEFIQEPRRAEFNYFWVERELDNHARKGVLAGMFLEIPLSRALTLQPELLFTIKGATLFDVSLGAGSNQPWTDYDVTYRYLELPVLLKLGFAKDKPLSPYFLAGPYIAWTLSTTYKWEIRFSKDNPVIWGFGEDSIETAPSMDYGVVLGAGVRIKIDSIRLDLEARYSQGFRNALTGFDDDDYTIFRSKHHMLAFVLGFRF